MTSKAKVLNRVFLYLGRDLPDPNPQFTPDEVLEHYASLYPKLQGGKVIPQSETDEAVVYQLEQRVGEHG